MERPGSLHEEQHSQVSEGHESKDSQAILDALKAELGWGALCSSECTNGRTNGHGDCRGGGKGAGGYPCTNRNGRNGHHEPGCLRSAPRTIGRAAPAGTASITQVGSSASVLPAAGHEAMIENERIPSARSRLRNGDSRIIEPSDEDDDDDNNVVIEQSSPTQPAIIPSSLHGRMETSQPSPTQVNTDRDYRELYDSNIGNNGNNDDSNNKNNNVINNNAQSSEHDYASFSKGDEVELRNLQVDDGTGAVDFGDLEVRASSQISEDAGFENTRSLWRTYRASQHMPNADYTPRKLDDLLPETPAVPRNPFSAAARDASNVPLAGTQLFRETQLLTSAAKQTPASVRPSPRLLYDMTSPNTEPSPLKDGMGISSPTDAPPSSRWKPARQDASRARTGRPSLDDLAFESPSVKPAKPRSVRQPLAHYEPMKHSQQRKARIEESPAAASREVMNSDSDDDALLELERRKRMVEKKKAQAARELDKVSFVRAGSHRESAISPGRKRRRIDSPQSRELQQGDSADTLTPGAKRTDAGLRKRRASPLETDESTRAIHGKKGAGMVCPDSDTNERVPTARNKVTRVVVDEERIPATSPARSLSAGLRQDAALAPEAELPTPKRGALDELPRLESDAVLPTSSDLPLVRGRAQRSQGRQARIQQSARNTIASETDGDGLFEKPSTSMQVHPASQIGTTRSTISTLTPVPSSISTADTSASLGSDSPIAGRSTRPRRLRSSARPASPRPASTDSTDELQRSPASTAGFGATTSKSGRALGRSFRHASSGAAHNAHHSGGLFTGMAFAISMLSEQSGMQRSFLEQKITQAGGLILEDGFQGLFEASPAVNARGQIIEEGDALRLAQASSDCGFTALIADGHSRKSKYMQALALGLPCLAHQWISACLARGEIVDWQPYLLAAGVSAALGDAVRSRCLRPYPAVGARLAESVEQRPRLLAGQSLLLVANPKGAWSSTKEYIFLAQALGPRVHRVCTARDAYEALSAREKDRHVFDWIYIDEAIGTVDLLLPVGNRPAAGKKRKKTAVIPPRVHDIRVLSNELVIQSLISGRMIGEDEIPEKGYRG